MEKELKKYMQNGLMLYDYILINLLHTLSLLQIQQLHSHYNSLQIVLFGLFINLGWYFIAVALRLYNIESLFINNWNIVKVLFALFLFGLSALLFLVLLNIPLVNRVQLVPYYLLLIVLIFLSRFLYQVVKYFLFKQSGFLNNTLIIGYNNTSKKLAEYLQNSVGALKLVGYVDEPENIKELSVLPVFSGIANTINIAKQYGINEIYSTITPEEHPEVAQLLPLTEQACMRLHFVPNVSHFIEKGMVVQHLHHLSICSLRKDPLEDVGNRIIKRIFDLSVSIFVTVFILSWLYPLIAILIKASSQGPILFKQLRSGINDKPFYCLKFRTMLMNNHADHVQATKNDSRVTWVGKFLRKSSLDEFPQFLNVLKGEMSIVGPRPHMLKHTKEFSAVERHYMVRHLLKPGITGWAQVNGYRGEIKDPTQLTGRIECDIWYLENWSLFLDLKIILLTIYRVFAGDKNAY
jgi:putative colanic acid biosynthesis UDP-glucose lipid carrier transferase